MSGSTGAFDTWHAPMVVCPECGFELDPLTNGFSSGHGDVDNSRCPRCGVGLRIEVTVNVLYTTTLRPEPAEDGR